MREEVDLKELERYLRLYQENPDSRIFAPLADLYRKLGRLKEAEEICREGLVRHPYYSGGKVTLAHLLLDMGRYEESLRESEAVVTYHPENVLARKLLIRSQIFLGQGHKARVEYETLRQVSPLVGADREIERLLEKGPPPSMPSIESGAKILNFNSNVSKKPVSSQENQRAMRLKILQKKKWILESWIRKLGSAETLR